jgi:acyl-coenzyme A thioesterase PaaI-like protein
MSVKSFFFKTATNLWPPLLGAGVRVTDVNEDITSIDVEMKLHKWNRNREKIQFGGGLSTMTDPFFGLILIENLGKDYMIVDKEATIHFKKPGKGTVTAHFNISAQRIAEIKKEADTRFKSEPHFTVEIKDESGNTVAEVERTLYIRRRNKQPIHGYKPPQP